MVPGGEVETVNWVWLAASGWDIRVGPLTTAPLISPSTLTTSTYSMVMSARLSHGWCCATDGTANAGLLPEACRLVTEGMTGGHIPALDNICICRTLVGGGIFLTWCWTGTDDSTAIYDGSQHPDQHTTIQSAGLRSWGTTGLERRGLRRDARWGRGWWNLE